VIFIQALIYSTLFCAIVALASLFTERESYRRLGKHLSLLALVVGLALWQGMPLLPTYWFWWIDETTLQASAMGTIIVPRFWGPLFATLGSIDLFGGILRNRSKANKSGN
jgi:hypothetical protein